METKGVNYFGNHVGAPQILQGTPNYNVEVSEGMQPPGQFYPATYLPIVESENRLQGSGFVLMPGKAVAFDRQTANINGRLIPAGLAWDVKTGVAASIASATDPATDRAAAIAAMDATGAFDYGALSVEMGVRNISTNLAVAAVDNAAADMYDAWAAGDLYGLASGDMPVTDPVGIIRYASLMSPGTDPSNPATFFKHSYDTGGSRAFSRWGYIQVPVLEMNARTEDIVVGAREHRVALWTDGSAFVFGTVTPTLVSGPDKFVAPAVAGTPDQYCVVGRTLLFNDAFDTADTVTYTPRLDTPFTCLKVDRGATMTTANAFSGAELIGQKVSYDLNSNFGTVNDLGGGVIVDTNYTLGQVLDVKSGTDKDLNLVLTWFRDQGLWQEQPGNATDGRNTQLALANAPRLVARIAVNFNFWA